MKTTIFCFLLLTCIAKADDTTNVTISVSAYTAFLQYQDRVAALNSDLMQQRRKLVLAANSTTNVAAISNATSVLTATNAP